MPMRFYSFFMPMRFYCIEREYSKSLRLTPRIPDPAPEMANRTRVDLKDELD